MAIKDQKFAKKLSRKEQDHLSENGVHEIWQLKQLANKVRREVKRADKENVPIFAFCCEDCWTILKKLNML